MVITPEFPPPNWYLRHSKLFADTCFPREGHFNENSESHYHILSGCWKGFQSTPSFSFSPHQSILVVFSLLMCGKLGEINPDWHHENYRKLIGAFTWEQHRVLTYPGISFCQKKKVSIVSVWIVFAVPLVDTLVMYIPSAETKECHVLKQQFSVHWYFPEFLTSLQLSVWRWQLPNNMYVTYMSDTVNLSLVCVLSHFGHLLNVNFHWMQLLPFPLYKLMNFVS